MHGASSVPFTGTIHERFFLEPGWAPKEGKSQPQVHLRSTWEQAQKGRLEEGCEGPWLEVQESLEVNWHHRRRWDTRDRDELFIQKRGGKAVGAERSPQAEDSMCERQGGLPHIIDVTVDLIMKHNL